MATSSSPPVRNERRSRVLETQRSCTFARAAFCVTRMLEEAPCFACDYPIFRWLRSALQSVRHNANPKRRGVTTFPRGIFRLLEADSGVSRMAGREALGN